MIKNFIYKLLRKSEKYTKTDMVYLAKGGFWLTLGQVIASFSGLAVTTIFANYLSEHNYGTYKFILSVSGMIALFSLTGMSLAVTRSVSKGYENTIRKAFLTTFKWSILVLLISWGLSVYYWLNNNQTLAISMLIIGIFVPITQSASLFGAFLVGKQDFATNSKIGMLQTIVLSTILILTILITKNPIIIILIQFLTASSTGLLAYFYVLKKHKPNKKNDPSGIKYGKHLSLMNILGGVSTQIDKILVFHYIGAAQLAAYSIALAAPQQIRYLNKIVNIMALPRFSKRNISELKQTMLRKALILFVIAIFLTTTYIMIAPYLFQLLFPKYINAVKYSQAFSLVILVFPNVLFIQSLSAHMQNKKLYTLNIVSPIQKITLLIILLPRLGIWGAIIAILITQFTRFILSVIFFYQMKEPTETK